MSERSPRGRPRRRGGTRLLLGGVVLAAAFVAGVGLGEALHDTPRAGGTQTLVRTLHPLSLVPVLRETVTVTTSGGPRP